MKRIVILFIFLHVFLANVNAQEKAANKIIDEINNLLDADKNATIKKFSLEAKNLVAFDKKGKKITASLNDIDSVTLNKNTVTLFCNQKKSCFFNNETKKYQASITCTHNTKALELSSKFRLLLKSFKNESTTQPQSTTYMDDFYADWFSESDEEPDNKKPVNAAQLNYNKSSKELAEINNYLKTFDGGYYGYLEIKEGYLFNYFKDNKNHRKAKLTELKEAAVISAGKKVGYKCISNNKCTFSTFTNSYHDEFNFATSKDFNTTELIRILNKILLLTKTTEEEEIDFKKYESNIDILKPSTTNNSKLPNNKINQDTKNALTKEEAYKKLVADYEEMNKHIRTLDNGRYLGVSVENGYIISHYANRDSSKAKIEDIAYVKAEKNYNYVKLACNGDSKCIYSTITGQYHDYFNFNCTSANIDKTELVLKNFLSSLKNYMPFENQSANSQQPKNKANSLEPAIKAINEYLPKFNSVTYKQVKVQGDDVLFEFYFSSQVYHAKISKADLKNNTKIVTSTPTTFKIECTNGNSCFWSTFANEYKSDFQFFMGANPKGNLKTMQQLVEALVKAL